MLFPLFAGCGGGGSSSGGNPQTKPTPTVPAPTADESRLADLIRTAAGQGRTKMRYNAFLAKAARDHAIDMAKRNYFSHTTPEGYGPNYRVRQTGYPLPSNYDTAKDANQVESLGILQNTPELMLQDWLNSASHREHVLATVPFFAQQIDYGIAHYHDPNSQYKDYWVFIAAKPAN